MITNKCFDVLQVESIGRLEAVDQLPIFQVKIRRTKDGVEAVAFVIMSGRKEVMIDNLLKTFDVPISDFAWDLFIHDECRYDQSLLSALEEAVRSSFCYCEMYNPFLTVPPIINGLELHPELKLILLDKIQSWIEN